MPGGMTVMQHERHRWSYMSDAQLDRRLNKIKNPQKMRAFRVMCIEENNLRMASAFDRRAYDLGLHHLTGTFQEITERNVEVERSRGVTQNPLIAGMDYGDVEERARRAENYRRADRDTVTVNVKSSESDLTEVLAGMINYSQIPAKYKDPPIRKIRFRKK